MSPIEFDTSLNDKDWVDAIGGWRCEALRIPGAKLEALYYDGKKADTNSFSVETPVIRWPGTPRPSQLLARISFSLTNDLSLLETEKIQLAKEKLNVETKWKIITAIGAILSGLLTFGTTYLIELGIYSRLRLSEVHQTPASWLKTKIFVPH